MLSHYTSNWPVTWGEDEEEDAENVAIFYKSSDYSGPSKSLPEGRYGDVDMWVPDGDVDSFWVKPGYRIVVYSRPGFTGTTMTLRAKLRRINRGLKRSFLTGSLVVERKRDPVVTLYAETEYRGKSVALGEGRYDLRDLGFPDNRLGSLKITRPYIIFFRSMIRGPGGRYQYDSDIPDLRNNYSTLFNIYIPDPLITYRG
jgi:hypothetical protein